MTHDERMAMTETIEQRTRQLLSYASGGIDVACESLYALIAEFRRLDAENERLRAGNKRLLEENGRLRFEAKYGTNEPEASWPTPNAAPRK